MASLCLFTAEHHLPLICCRDIRAVGGASGSCPPRTVSAALCVSHASPRYQHERWTKAFSMAKGFFPFSDTAPKSFLWFYLPACVTVWGKQDAVLRCGIDGLLTWRLASAADVCEFWWFLASAKFVVHIDTEMSIVLIPNVSVLGSIPIS